MKLIGLNKEGKGVSVQFYGCQLRCPYCTHIRQPKTEKEIQEVLEFIADPKVEEVYLGGAEPTVQKNALLELLQRLGRMHKKITLKTNGMDPAFLRETLGLVDQYMLEIKCPLDDGKCNADLTGLSERATMRYVSSLGESLKVLRGKEVRIWIRVIPGFMDQDRIARIGRQVSGVATEAYLMQFLGVQENEAPFGNVNEPGPSEAGMVALARVLLEYVPNVYVRGRDFRADFRAGTRP